MRRNRKGRAWLLIRDAGFVMICFLAITAAIGCAPTSAHPVASGLVLGGINVHGPDVSQQSASPIVRASAYDGAKLTSTADDDGKQWLILGLTISFLAALNLAVMRHLRRVYAPAKCR